MTTLLLTGFGPFGPYRENPSWEALKLAHARGLFGLAAGVVVEIAPIPVEYARAFAEFERALSRTAPAACVSFGVHGGKDGALLLERTARNRGGDAPDTGGRSSPGEIVAGGEAELASTLPLPEIRQRLADAGHCAEFSDDAGRYLCNHLFYRGAHALRDRIPYGFIHVPPVTGDGIERLSRAMAIIVEALKSWL